MSEVLIFLHGTQFFYQVGNTFYSSDGYMVTPRGVFPQQLQNNTSPHYPVATLINRLASQPILMYLSSNSQSIPVLASYDRNNDVLQIIPFVPLTSQIDDYIINGIQLQFDVPEPRQTEGIYQLQFHRFNSFDRDIYNEIFDFSRTLRPLRELGHPIQLIDLSELPPRSPVTMQIDPVTGLPNFVELHGLNVPFITFEQVPQIISKVARFFVDPELQHYARNGNSIVTLFLNNGLTYLVNARLNSSGQIFPPM